MAARRKKVVCAMSGGVDSSVASALLLRAGYDVIGVFMRLGTPPGVGEPAPADVDPESDKEACETSGKNKQGCCSVLDAADARRVAALLNIPFYVLNFQEDFGRVIDYFVSEYNRGRTPNPCVRCNDWLKFGKLFQYAKAVGADFVASGHYARVGEDPASGKRCLMRGRDHKKDQSYVLFGISPEAIEHTLLPIGEMEKSDVRRMAEELNLPVFNKPDSQEICFVPDQDYAGLVKRRTPGAFRPGELVTTAGEAVGTHEGHQHFTIGQRKGVGVAKGYPLYVVQIDPKENRVTLGSKDETLKRTLIADQTNILTDRLPRGEPSSVGLNCHAKIRYNHSPQPCRAWLTETNDLAVIFDEPQTAITPGQAVVLYDGDVVLGGGWIDRAEA